MLTAHRPLLLSIGRVKCCATKDVFLCFLTVGQVPKRVLAIANRCFLRQESEEMVDIFLHSTETRVLCELLFSLFGVPWVVLFVVRALYLVGVVFSLQRRGEECRKCAPCVFFGLFGKRGMTSI